MGSGSPESDSVDVLKGRSRDQPGQYEDTGIHYQLHLG